ncbi:hypothetical protein E1258_08720 [Micromonospora sp. KC207]|uniref:YCII-related domain-containing protein n=2 Tax=Micromonospora TaxID=1873 RepID=A0A7D6CGX1_9ACTN|nr:hypothetical protein MCAG_03243 [Micromonospora sp. ATCC 39149]QLK01154.1 hypothetical protein HZU44_01935 [Micromonospora carbonacea]TDC64248.1 hypothetical protein E1258_08720 [Micromonospora sp. KC207]
MYVVLLRFSDNKAAAPQHMAGHNAWIQQGLDDGVFLLVGGIAPGQGGAVLAHNTTPADLEVRVKADPFVAENVVTAEIIEITPGAADERLAFLLP